MRRHLVIHRIPLNPTVPGKDYIEEYSIEGTGHLYIDLDFIPGVETCSFTTLEGYKFSIGPYKFRVIEYNPWTYSVRCEEDGFKASYLILRRKLYWKSRKFWRRVFKTLVIWNLADIHEGQPFRWSDIHFLRRLRDVKKKSK